MTKAIGPPPRGRGPITARGWMVALAAVLLGAGCAQRSEPAADARPRVLTPSAVWASSVSPEAYDARVAALTAAVERLRAETRTGWTGRQDDQTGYLSELSGGSYPDGAADLLEAYSAELFGVDPAQLDASAETGGQSVQTVEVAQRLGVVPVLTAKLVVTISGEPARVRVIRGRVYPDVDVGTEPALARAAARGIARRESRGTVEADRLVVLPVPAPGRLAWEVLVAGPRDPRAGDGLLARYYVAADDGSILDVQPASGEATAADLGSGAGAGLGQVPTGDVVDVSGAGPRGQPLTGKGLRTADGSILLIDTTLPWFDPAGRAGATITRNGMATVEDAPIASFPSATIDDPEVMAVHAFGRYTLDYFREVHDRSSWDGRGGTLTLTARYPVRCNAMFGEEGFFGDPSLCPLIGTFADIDVMAHEIAHGVTSTTSDLVYQDQPGAMNESFSDYFGSVIGNRMKGRDDATLGEGACEGITSDTPLCTTTPEGSRGTRYMLSGATFRDFVSFMDQPPALPVYEPDNGGVHLNSAVWNNALWSIRSRLALMDGQPGVTSPRAQAFDSVVYRALTQILTPLAGMVEGRRAIEQAATDLAVEPVILQVAREVFDQNLICDGCIPPRASPAIPVAQGIASQVRATVAGDRIAWLEVSETGGARPAYGAQDVPGIPVESPTPLGGVALAGPDSIIVAGGEASAPRVYRLEPGSAALQELAPTSEGGVAIGLAGSSEGAAWLDPEAGRLSFVDLAGRVTTTPVSASGTYTSIATGGRTVAAGTSAGQVVAWRVGAEPTVLTAGGQVAAVGAFGNRVLSVTVPSFDDFPALFRATVTLHNLDSGTSTTLSGAAAGYGAAVSERYAVWTEVTGDLQGPVADAYRGRGLPVPDTSLYLYSFATGRVYDVLPGLAGQQGFPAISGDRLAWQDAVAATDDIYTGRLPAGL